MHNGFADTAFLDHILLHLGWKGNDRQIMEALPSDKKIKNLQDFLNTLSHLGFAGAVYKLKTKQLLRKNFPVVKLGNDAPYLVLTKEEAATFEDNGEYIVFKESRPDHLLPLSNQGLRQEITRFSPLLHQVVIVSLMIGAVSLAPIYYNRSIFDHIIASGSSAGYTSFINGFCVTSCRLGSSQDQLNIF